MKSKLQTVADGRAHAADLLNVMGRYETDDLQSPWSIKAIFRPVGQAQDNVALEYLGKLQKHGTPEALAGFCSVLTDFLGQRGPGMGSGYDGSEYESLTKREMTGRSGKWPRIEDDPIMQPSASGIPAASSGRGLH